VSLSNRQSKVGAILAGIALLLLALLPAGPVSAHHGWNSFDTRRAYFASGTITLVRWGNPHSEVHLRVERTNLPANWAEWALPPGANERDGRETMASARPYAGEHKELHLVLAGPEWMARWGLNRALNVGEMIEVVGYLGAADDQDVRPVMFWVANGQGVWQQLTSFPRRPEPAPNN
jgi:hypothetical protein